MIDAHKKVIGRCGIQGQGPFMYIELEGNADIIATATFETYGCPTAIRCGDWVAKWAKGKQPEVLLILEPHDLALVVGGVPLGKEHCTQITVTALRDAISQISAGERDKNES